MPRTAPKPAQLSSCFSLFSRSCASLMDPDGDWTPLTATDMCRIWRLDGEGKPVQQKDLPGPQKLIFLR